MTSRCYFGKMNSILGSVVPLAMFTVVDVDAEDNVGNSLFLSDPSPIIGNACQ